MRIKDSSSIPLRQSVVEIYKVSCQHTVKPSTSTGVFFSVDLRALLQTKKITAEASGTIPRNTGPPIQNADKEYYPFSEILYQKENIFLNVKTDTTS